MTRNAEPRPGQREPVRIVSGAPRTIPSGSSIVKGEPRSISESKPAAPQDTGSTTAAPSDSTSVPSWRDKIRPINDQLRSPQSSTSGQPEGKDPSKQG